MYFLEGVVLRFWVGGRRPHTICILKPWLEISQWDEFFYEWVFLFVCFCQVGALLGYDSPTCPSTVSNVENKNATSKLISTQCSRLELIDFLVVMRPDITKKWGEKVMFPYLLVTWDVVSGYLLSGTSDHDSTKLAMIKTFKCNFCLTANS